MKQGRCIEHYRSAKRELAKKPQLLSMVALESLDVLSIGHTRFTTCGVIQLNTLLITLTAKRCVHDKKGSSNQWSN